MALPPRRLTKRQFLAKAPVNPVRGRTGQERYNAYLNAYKSQHGQPPNQAGNRGGPPNQPFAGPTYESLLRGIRIQTPEQMMKQAERMANIGITAQQKIIREEAQLMRDEAMGRMQAQAAAGLAAAQLNSQLFGMVGGEYNAAANEIRGLATNLTGSQAAANAADVSQNNAMLTNLGAANLPVGGPAGGPGLGGAAQQQVEEMRGGVIPGQMIGTAGQAAMFGLSGMVAAQNSRAVQEAQATMRESVSQANRDRMSALKQLAAGRPAEAQKFLAQLQANADNARNIAMSLLAARQQFGLQAQGNERATNAARDARRAAAEALRVSRQNRAIAEKNAALQGREISIDLSRSRKIYVDRLGRPILTPEGSTIPFKETPAAPSTPESGEQWTDVRYDVQRSVNDAIEDATTRGGKVSRQVIIKQMKSLYAKRFWPRIVAYINAMPNSAFARPKPGSGDEGGLNLNPGAGNSDRAK